MGMGEDEFLVPKQSVFGDTGNHDRLRQQPGLRKLLQPLAVALGIFGVSAAAARYLFPRKKIQPQQQMLQTSGRHAKSYGADSGPSTSYCATSTKIVLEGADLTSYFSLEHGGSPVFGVAEHETVYNGYSFWFASEENKAKFEAQPLAYIPAWGGFCSWGIAGETWWTRDTLGPQADPELWLITDEGRLHFFRSPTPMSKFMVDVEANIIAGDGVWTEWWGEAVPGTGDVNGTPLNTNCFCSPETCEDA